MAELTLMVNGKARVVNVEPDTPLLWVLRDTIKLTGTKYSCGEGLCGSCSVLMDGEAVRSCVLPVSQAVGHRLVTIEGLSKDGHHPLQKVWIEDEVPQCGYCQSGQLISAAALLAKKPRPTDADIDEAMSDVLCRCGTYQRIRRAIHRAAGEVSHGQGR
jgi:aerobic-type carbon monoxide dehydrogenase small subunit (CoxS/CutS family)